MSHTSRLLTNSGYYISRTCATQLIMKFPTKAKFKEESSHLDCGRFQRPIHSKLLILCQGATTFEQMYSSASHPLLRSS